MCNLYMSRKVINILGQKHPLVSESLSGVNTPGTNKPQERPPAPVPPPVPPTPPNITGDWTYYVKVLRYDTPGTAPTFEGNTYIQSFAVSIQQNGNFVIIKVPKAEPLRPDDGYYVGYWNIVYTENRFFWQLCLSDYDDNGVYTLTISQITTTGQIIKLDGSYIEAGFGPNPPGVQKPTAGNMSLTKIVSPTLTLTLAPTPTPPNITGDWTYYVKVLRYDTPGTAPTFEGNTYIQSFAVSIQQNGNFVIIKVPKAEPLRPDDGYYVGYWNIVYNGSGFFWQLCLSDYDDNGVYTLTTSQVDTTGQIIKLDGSYIEAGFGPNPPGVQKPTAGNMSLTKILPSTPTLTVTPTPPNIIGDWTYYVKVLRYDTPGTAPTFEGNTYTQSFPVSIQQNGNFVIIKVPKAEPLRPDDGYYVGYWNIVYTESGFFWQLCLSDYDDNGVYTLTTSQITTTGQTIKLDGSYIEAGFGENPPGVQKPTAGNSSLTKIV
jgi:hypothetical protein